MRILKELRRIGIKAAKDAGKFLKDNFGQGKLIKSKSRFDYLSDADLQSERIIIDILKETSFSIISEEAGYIKGEESYKWLVDPLDGTLNYVNSIPFFSISIALLHRNGPVLAIVYDPLRKEMYIADNIGCYLNGERIFISNRKSYKKWLVGFGTSYSERETALNYYSSIFSLTPKIRRFGAGSLTLAYVASGRLDGAVLVFKDGNKNPWDYVPGCFLVEAAGGEVTNVKGEDWKTLRNSIIAGSEFFNKKIRKLLFNSRS